MVASFVYGLKPDSRSKMLLSNMVIPTEILLLCGIIDRLNWLVWSKTKDAEKGKNKPKPILEPISKQKNKEELRQYKTGKDFEVERQKILKGVNNGN